MLRTQTCGELRKSHVGQRVTLCGWADTVRDHGGIIFIDLRDRYGLTQIVFDPSKPEIFAIGEHLRNEFVLAIVGLVRRRPAS